jgi:3'-phosphoadenosine 5'-phosphosulfate sulfotransferase (PAPS reductase)/FAD synthetase
VLTYSQTFETKQTIKTTNEHDNNSQHYGGARQPQRDFWELAKWKKRFPSAKARFCTTFLKMIPTQEHVLKLANEGARVLLHSGVRADESPDRAKLAEREFDGFYGLEVYRPLLRWKLADVLAIHKRHGVPLNPLYALGAKRVGCLPCIMSRKAEIRMIAQTFPAVIDNIREQERSFDSINGISTFFASNTVPARFRSKPITTLDGRKLNVATIDDIVRWSLTGKRAKGSYTDDDDAGLCPSKMGACE